MQKSWIFTRNSWRGLHEFCAQIPTRTHLPNSFSANINTQMLLLSWQTCVILLVITEPTIHISFVSPQWGTCVTSPLWRVEFWGYPIFLENLCHTVYTQCLKPSHNRGNKMHDHKFLSTEKKNNNFETEFRDLCSFEITNRMWIRSVLLVELIEFQHRK
jgi:hypothetical protein